MKTRIQFHFSLLLWLLLLLLNGTDDNRKFRSPKGLGLLFAIISVLIPTQYEINIAQIVGVDEQNKMFKVQTV